MATYTLRQLAKASGYAPRTIRKYTQHGLVPRTVHRGPLTVFGDEHLARLKEIAAVQATGYFTIPDLIAELAARARARAEREAAATTTPRLPVEKPAPPVGAARPIGKRWSHVTLAPGLVLLVRERASDVVTKIAGEIVEKYGAE